MPIINVFLLFALNIICAFANSDKSVTVCREDKYDDCRCRVGPDDDKIQYLDINCYNWDKLTTTNINLPRRVFNTYDIEYITIWFGANQIRQISSPAISDQLSSKLRSLTIKDSNINQIDPNVFDNTSMLENLTFFNCGLQNDIIRSDWLTAKLGTSLLNLSFQNNNITLLNPYIFSQLEQLKSLDFSFNQIQSISDNAFYGLTNLSTLDVKINKLIEVPTNALSKLNNLKKLDLSGNLFKQIQDNAFDGLDGLLELNLKYTGLINIPSIALKQLKRLDLSVNRITDIPDDSFSNLQALTSLSLNINRISQISSNGFRGLKRLVELNLSSNNLMAIPTSSFGQIGNIQILDLGQCQIQNILPNAFSSLIKLKELYLYYNSIQIIPIDGFAGLNNLSRLDLAYNLFTQIPTASFVHLHHLKKLHVDYNAINEIKNRSFINLPNLKIFSLQGNALNRIESNAFSGLTSLREIDLSQTELKKIPTQALSKLKSLKTLELNNNEILKIEKNSFYGLSELDSLYLSSNLIKSIESYAFTGLGNLTGLNIGSNQIESVEHDAFDGLTELISLTMSRNINLTFTNHTFKQYALENLETLYLDECALSTLPDNFLQALPNIWDLNLNSNTFTSIPTTIRNIRQLNSLDLSDNPIRKIESHTFNGSRIHDLIFDKTSLTTIDDCAFCGLTVWSLSLENIKDLTSIHRNAFGFSNNSIDKTRKIREIHIFNTSIETLDKNLLKWNKLDEISMTNNPANCNPAMDWLFRDPNLKWGDGREDRCSEDRCKEYPFYEPCQSTTKPTQIVSQTSKTTTETSFGTGISIDIFILTLFCFIGISLRPMC